MKTVAYHRTSTADQHIDRGIAEIKKYCAEHDMELYKNKVYTDQQTGQNFNRPRYQMLKEEILESGDTLIVTELDRLGRNKKATLEELRYYQDSNMPYRMNGGSMYYDGGSQPMYYNGSNGNNSSNSSNGNSSSNSSGGNNARGGGTRGFYEYEMPMHMRDEREGKSPMSRKTYMESKEMHQDKNVKLKELEKYMQELTSDMVEMIQDSSPEEKQYLEKKITALASKIGQMK